MFFTATRTQPEKSALADKLVLNENHQIPLYKATNEMFDALYKSIVLAQENTASVTPSNSR